MQKYEPERNIMKTIISNNCSGAYMMRALNIKYNSPTIFLQVLPDEYPKFCNNLKEYMQKDLIEYKDYSDKHIESMKKLLGEVPGFPCGLLGDVAILFQHEKSFDEAKRKWDRRKERIDWNHIGYMFCLEFSDFKEAAKEYGELRLPHSVLFTRSFDVDVPIEHYRYDVPVDSEYLAIRSNGKFVFESYFDRETWYEEI